MKPKTAFTSAPAKAAPNVSLYDATARGSETVSQKRCQEMVAVFRKRPESGISTIRLRYSTVSPRVSPNPGRTLRRLDRHNGLFIGRVDKSGRSPPHRRSAFLASPAPRRTAHPP